ncbi:putative peptidoglycan-binding domain-containing protein [Chryseobacterium sp. FH1]|uniref:putative peptidoglycan-binding domain-containing protein n=1 Tax=Chryseobacterium sp. FH1 TaxID=1233951 RepID=UPI0004E44026|nr:putative peptidoglycan-binding domain-containing protein [Chryseobacterium sp. FH1]KFC19360.1 hypothetical protein IO90_08635 [Chryseobacterium sp. FH1]
MKNLILILVIFLSVFSCKRNDVKPPVVNESVIVVDSFPVIVKDTVQIDFGYQKKYDSLLVLNLRKDFKIDSLTGFNNKIAKDLLHHKLIIKNAQYYLNITIKNPSQDKFLKGWMRRALNQETVK